MYYTRFERNNVLQRCEEGQQQPQRFKRETSRPATLLPVLSFKLHLRLYSMRWQAEAIIMKEMMRCKALRPLLPFSGQEVASQGWGSRTVCSGIRNTTKLVFGRAAAAAAQQNKRKISTDSGRQAGRTTFGKQSSATWLISNRYDKASRAEQVDKAFGLPTCERVSQRILSQPLPEETCQPAAATSDLHFQNISCATALLSSKAITIGNGDADEEGKDDGSD